MIKNEITSKLTHISDTRYRLSLEIPSDIVDETFNFFYNKAQTNSTIKGFRPGKAPLDMIKKKYQQEVRYNVCDHLINKFLNKAMDSYNLRLTKKLNMQIEQFSEGIPLKLFAEFEARKDISIENVDNLLKNINKLCVVKEKLKIDKVEEMVEFEIDKQKESLGIRTPIDEIRKIKPNEYCMIDCKCFYNNKLIGTLNDLLFVAFSFKLAMSGDKDSHLDDKIKNIENVTKIITIPSFHAVDKMLTSFLNDEYLSEPLKYNLIDMKPGQTKEIPVAYPSDHIAYSKTSFVLQVHLKQIYDIAIPEIDDTFAKKSGFSSVQDMNTKLKQKYIDLEKRRIEEKLEKDILEELVKQNPVNIPKEYLLIQIEHIVQEKRKQMLKVTGEAQAHIIDKQIEAWNKEDRFKDDAIYALSEAILIQKFAKEWDLFEPIEREFHKGLATNRKFSKVASKFEANVSQLKNVNQKDVMSPILFEMLKRAVVQQIISKATIKES